MYTLLIFTILSLPGQAIQALVPPDRFGPMSLEACLVNVQLMGAQKQPDSRVVVAGVCVLHV